MAFASRTVFLTAGWLACTAPAFADTVQDARLEGALQTALSLNEVLNPYAIHVEIDGARARLSGKVENQVERQLAGRVAQATRGIEAVDNQLVLDPDLAEQPADLRAYAKRLHDATLSAIVQARLLWSRATQNTDIEAQSREGVVTLRGRVDSVEAKELAGVIARMTDGVYLVNNLVSLDSAALAQARETPVEAEQGPQPSDAWIVDKIQASYRFSRNLDVVNIKVASEQGLVQLSGEVVSAEQKTIAQEVARQIVGVRGVDADMLRVAIKAEG